MLTHTALRLPVTHDYVKKATKQNTLQKFKDWVHYFLDQHISDSQKSQRAEQYLQQLFLKLDPAQAGWIAASPQQVTNHFMQQHHETCARFQNYILQRKQNGPRQYFPTPSHALEFLYKVAPVKLVDGSWLYSALQRFQEPEAKDLIYIYLEELGLGDRQANHVNMYQDLLDHYELSPYINQLDNSYFEQAAVQLALAYAPAHYLPLVIGFNLGYEQLPLHLLITNYELAEVGIDPNYFNVHITIDNAHNGHAKKSLDAFLHYYQQSENQEEYLRLVQLGYLMNDLGKSSSQIIQDIDLRHSVIEIFKQKSIIGKYIHNQRCQFKGRTINEWLSEPEQIQQFIDILIEKEWIKLGQPVEQSRFWQMIDAPDGRMFGVFTVTEKQFIKDWIQGSVLAQRLRSGNPNAAVLQQQPSGQNQKLQQLQQRFQLCDDLQLKLEMLSPYLAPDQHHQPIGLWATRQYAKIMLPFQYS